MPALLKPVSRLAARGLCGVWLCAGLLALPPAALAIDWSTADWGGYSPDALSYWQYRDAGQRSVKQMQRGGSQGGTARAPDPKAALSTAGNIDRKGAFKQEAGLDKLARLYPREQFYERRKQFRQIVQGFNGSVEKLYGVPPNNLATALTVAVAGAYSAYHNQAFPDGWVKPLYRQMEARLLQDPRLQERDRLGKYADYQVMVGTGMAMMLTQAELQKAPDAAALAGLRRSGAEALHTLFQADPASLKFSARGVSLP